MLSTAAVDAAATRQASSSPTTVQKAVSLKIPCLTRSGTAPVLRRWCKTAGRPIDPAVLSAVAVSSIHRFRDNRVRGKAASLPVRQPAASQPT